MYLEIINPCPIKCPCVACREEHCYDTPGGAVRVQKIPEDVNTACATLFTVVEAESAEVYAASQGWTKCAWKCGSS